MANAVLVIDMVRGFLEEGHPLYCGERARRIIPGVKHLLEQELARDAKVLFICDHHAPDDAEFKLFPPHCIAGTAEAELIPELAGYQGEVIPKRRFSAFFDTPLEERLNELGPDRLIVCGVCTDICVCIPCPMPGVGAGRWKCRLVALLPSMSGRTTLPWNIWRRCWGRS
jgi:nicotinamidase-related amidase